MALNSF